MKAMGGMLLGVGDGTFNREVAGGCAGSRLLLMASVARAESAAQGGRCQCSAGGEMEATRRGDSSPSLDRVRVLAEFRKLEPRTPTDHSCRLLVPEFCSFRDVPPRPICSKNAHRQN